MAKLNPYVNFRGQAREAMEFYHSVFGGEMSMATFADFGMPGVPEGEENNIMHSQLVAPNGMALMVSDVPSSMPFSSGSSITISLSGDETDELQGYWDKLSDGAQIGMELAPAPWGDSFGQLTDKFGISWLVNIAGPGNQNAGDTAGEGTGTAGDSAPEEI